MTNRPEGPDRAVLESLITRRRLLGTAGAGAVTLGLGGVLAACGGNSSTSATSSSNAKPGGEFDLLTWEGYDFPQVLKGWRTKYGIDQKAQFLNTQDAVQTKLSGPAGASVSLTTANNAYNDFYKQLEIMSPITVEEVPALADMYPYFRDSPIWKNEDGTYNSVPWTWGAIGLTYAPDRVPEPTSWMDIMESSAQGRVTTLDDWANNVTLAAIILGIDPDTMTKDELNGPVKDFLTQLMGQVKTLSPSVGDMVTLISSGEVDYVFIGLYLLDILAEGQGATTATVIPKEGGMGFVDAGFIPPDAPNRATAISYLNQVMSGQTAADAAAAILGGVPVPSVVPLLDKEVKNLFPYKDLDNFLTDELTFNRGYPQEPDGDRATFEDGVKLWEEVKAS